MSWARVLILEDNPSFRKFVRVTLEAEGYRVAVAGTPEEGLDLVRSWQPHLILQDLRLGGSDGLQVLESIRALPEGQDLPVVAISGWLSKLEEARALGASFVDYLFKPVDGALLIETVRRYAPPAREVQEEVAGRRVLLVDDDPPLRKLLQYRLQAAGLAVETAGTAEEALDLARANPPDAVVTDLLLPGMDGLAFAQAARRLPDLRDVPLVLVSSFVEDSFREGLVNASGADAMVERTPDGDAVVDALLQAWDMPRRTPRAPSGVDPLVPAQYVRQLKQQAALNRSLLARIGNLSSHIGIVGAVARVLAETGDLDRVLSESLTHLQGALAFPWGAVFLCRGEALSVRLEVGFPAERLPELPGFFGGADLLMRVLRERRPRLLPDADLPESSAILERAVAAGALLCPLVFMQQELGVLVLASPEREGYPDQIHFVEAVAVGLSSTILMARVHEDAQTARQASEQAAGVSQRLLRHVSHELRTPLSGILGNADLLTTTGLDPEQRALVEGLQLSTVQMVRLIEDLIQQARSGTDGLEVRRESFRPADLPAQTLRMVAGRLLRGRLDAEVALGADLPEVALGDPVRLRQALSLLLENATKFTPPGGGVRVVLDLAERDPGGCLLRFSVQDTGEGVAEEDRAALFTAFHRGPSDTPGLGVGLSLVRDLATAMGGEAGYASRQGGGSEFWFTARASAGVADDLKPDPRPPGRLRILVVEDNPVAQAVLTRYLARQGHEVAAVADGGGAVREVRGKGYDFVLMDCQLPGLDGYGATREIRDMPGIRQPVIIAITANALPEEEQKCRAVGMDDFLTKPVSLSLLLDRLASWAVPRRD